MPTAVLRQKDKRQKPAETRGRFNVGLSIAKRLREVRAGKTFGHRELDTVVSGRGKSKACVATFVERKSRFYIALPITDRSAASMERAIQEVHGELADALAKINGRPRKCLDWRTAHDAFNDEVLRLI